MTWEPKNGLHDEDVDVSDEEDGDNSFTKEDVKPNALGKRSAVFPVSQSPTTCKSQYQPRFYLYLLPSLMV